jgi:hypothetical protein
MSYTTVGDGMVAVALAAGIVGYVYVKHQSSRKRLEIIHEERMAAMEKGIPLPEFPLDPAQSPRIPDTTVLPLIGIMLFTFAIGTMIVLFRTLDAAEHSFWIAPLPVAFMGLGLLFFHYLKRDAGR